MNHLRKQEMKSAINLNLTKSIHTNRTKDAIVCQEKGSPIYEYKLTLYQQRVPTLQHMYK